MSTASDPFQETSPDAVENKYYTVISSDTFNFSIEGPSYLPTNR